MFLLKMTAGARNYGGVGGVIARRCTHLRHLFRVRVRIFVESFQVRMCFFCRLRPLFVVTADGGAKLMGFFGSLPSALYARATPGDTIMLRLSAEPFR